MTLLSSDLKIDLKEISFDDFKRMLMSDDDEMSHLRIDFKNLLNNIDFEKLTIILSHLEVVPRDIIEIIDTSYITFLINRINENTDDNLIYFNTFLVLFTFDDSFFSYFIQIKDSLNIFQIIDFFHIVFLKDLDVDDEFINIFTVYLNDIFCVDISEDFDSVLGLFYVLLESDRMSDETKIRIINYSLTNTFRILHYGDDSITHYLLKLIHYISNLSDFKDGIDIAGVSKYLLEISNNHLKLLSKILYSLNEPSKYFETGLYIVGKALEYRDIPFSDACYVLRLMYIYIGYFQDVSYIGKVFNFALKFVHHDTMLLLSLRIIIICIKIDNSLRLSMQSIVDDLLKDSRVVESDEFEFLLEMMK